MESIPIEDLSHDVPREAYELIGRAITAWARVESELLGLFAQATQQPFAIAGMVAGAMEPRGLFQRSMAVVAFRARLEKVRETKQIEKRLLEVYGRRNELAHGELFGTNVKTGELVFVLRRYTPADDPEETLLHVVTFSLERLRWIVEASDSLRERLGLIRAELSEYGLDDVSDY